MFTRGREVGGQDALEIHDGLLDIIRRGTTSASYSIVTETRVRRVGLMEVLRRSVWVENDAGKGDKVVISGETDVAIRPVAVPAVFRQLSQQVADVGLRLQLAAVVLIICVQLLLSPEKWARV